MGLQKKSLQRIFCFINQRRGIKHWMKWRSGREVFSGILFILIITRESLWLTALLIVVSTVLLKLSKWTNKHGKRSSGRRPRATFTEQVYKDIQLKKERAHDSCAGPGSKGAVWKKIVKNIPSTLDPPRMMIRSRSKHSPSRRQDPNQFYWIIMLATKVLDSSCIISSLDEYHGKVYVYLNS